MTDIIQRFAVGVLADDELDPGEVVELLAPTLPADLLVELADTMEICADHFSDIQICIDEEDCDRWP